ncbi:MAG: FAD-dependent oxidoreductase [Nitrospirota bacterium]
MNNRTDQTMILGAGLAGLAAGCVLTRAGRNVAVVEAGPAVGGLSRTMEHEGFRFDLGGHRFITHDRAIEDFVRGLLGNDCLEVPRTSQIHMRGRYFDYPLTPANAVFGMGLSTTARILADYAAQNLRSALFRPSIVSLEDWVVNRFGRAMFDLYFREYSEKVWGIGCGEISAEWVARRIEGLSLWEAIRNAFTKGRGSDIHTLADTFLYPREGIGMIADRLQGEIEIRNAVRTDTRVCRVDHDGSFITNVMLRQGRELYNASGRDYISSIPLTALLASLNPAPPEEVRRAAAKLAYRDLVVSTIMIDRDQVTDLTWMYLPEQAIPFGRIHEPKNWSPAMAPAGKTHIVAEYFCFRGDSIWNTGDADLTAMTVRHLCRMGFITEAEVIGSCVVRVPRAYPLFTIDYRKHADAVLDYLGRFRNLHVIGRGGMFRYHNMDHAMGSGVAAANEILRTAPAPVREPLLAGAAWS